MKKADFFYNMYKKDIWKAVFWNIALLFVLLCVFQPAYESNDDRYMSQIAEGVYGDYDAHLIFINIVLGKLISGAYALVGWMKWYNIFQYATLLLSFFSVTYVVLQKHKARKQRVIWSLLLIAFAYEAYINLQFTKTAGIAVAAGYLLLFFSLEERRRRSVWLAAILITVGGMYRFQCFLMVSFPMFVLGLFELKRVLSAKHKEPEQYLKKEIFRYGVVLLVVIGGTFALDRFDRYAYQSDSEWAAYREFNSWRARVMDYGIPSWEENQEAYTALGLTQSDVTNITRWMFADFEQVTVDTLKGIVQIREETAEKQDPVAFGKAFWKNVSVAPLFWVSAFLCIMLLLENGERRNLILLLLSGLLLIFMHAYLYWSGRYGVSRVDMVIYFSVLGLLLYQWRDAAAPARMTGAAAAVTMAGLAVFVLAINSTSVSEHLRKNATTDVGLKRLFSYMSADAEHLYYIDTHDEFLGTAYGFNEIAPRGLSANLYEMGGWMTHSPLYNKTLQAYGISNPLQALGERDDIYVVENTNYIHEKVNSLRQHYADNITYSVVKYIEGVNIYKVYPEGDLFTAEELAPAREETAFTVEVAMDETGRLLLYGYVCTTGENSYDQQIAVRLLDRETRETQDFYATQTEYGEMSCEEERYAGFMLTIDSSRLTGEQYLLTVVQIVDDEAYLLEEKDVTIR